MLSEKSRNLIVGFTVIAALVVLIIGMIILGKVPSFGGARPYLVTLLTKDANGSTPGAKVNLNGVVIGQVKSLTIGTDSTGQFQAKLLLAIDGKYNIPSNASANLGKDLGLGTPYISLYVSGPAATNLPRDGNATLTASTGESGSIIPKEITDELASVSKSLSTAANDLHVLLAYHTPEEIAAAATQPASSTEPRPVENISTLIIRLNRTTQSLEGLLADPKLQTQVRQIVQNLSDASIQLNNTLKKVDSTVQNADKTFNSFGDVAGKASKTLDTTQTEILKVSEKLVDALAQIQKTTKDLSEGNGTTGKLINDPRLYEGLVDLSKSMRSTVDDLDFLLKKWKDEGVNLHL